MEAPAAAAKRTRGHSAMVSPVPVALESTPRSRDRRPRTLIDGVETTSSRWSCSVEALAVAQDVQASDEGAHRRERWLNWKRATAHLARSTAPTLAARWSLVALPPLPAPTSIRLERQHHLRARGPLFESRSHSYDGRIERREANERR